MVVKKGIAIERFTEDVDSLHGSNIGRDYALRLYGGHGDFDHAADSAATAGEK